MSSMKNAEWGYAFIPSVPIPVAEQIVRSGSEAGFERVWIPDQTFHDDPFVLLGYLTGVTDGTKLGLAITSPYTRHPVQIARGAATVIRAGAVEFVLGLGIANPRWVLSPLGLQLDRSPARLRECASLVRALLAGESVHADTFWKMDGVKLDVSVDSLPPIFVGTRGPKTITAVAEEVDGYFLEALFAPKAMKSALDLIGAGTKRALDEFRRVAWQFVVVTTDIERDAQNVRTWAQLIIAQTAPTLLRKAGVKPEIIDGVKKASAAGDNAAAVDLVDLDTARCVVVAGTSDEVAAILVDALRNGATDIGCVLLGDLEAIQSQQDLIGREVRPKVESQLRTIATT